MAKKIKEVRSDYRKAEGTITSTLNEKSTDVKKSLYTKSVFFLNLFADDEISNKFAAYVVELGKAVPEFKDAVANVKGALSAENVEQILPACMKNSDGDYCTLTKNFKMVEDGTKANGEKKYKKVLVEREDYVAPTYKDKKGTYVDDYVETARYDYVLGDPIEWMWDKFRKMMEQGWRFKGVAPSAKEYALTRKFADDRKDDIEDYAEVYNK